MTTSKTTNDLDFGKILEEILHLSSGLESVQNVKFFRGISRKKTCRFKSIATKYSRFVAMASSP